MRMQTAVLAFAGATITGWAGKSEAIPAYARRYDVACHFCHEGFPKLNATGQRFKERGFRMAQADALDLEAWARTVPVTVRASGTSALFEFGDAIYVGLIKGVSAGSLGARLSYWVDDGFSISEHDGFRHRRVNNAWARLEVVADGKLYLKGGRLELDLPFTQARTPHLLPYSIYFANTGFETDNIGIYHHGIEVGGDLPGDTRWSAALVAGRNPRWQVDLDDEAGRFDGNLFLRLSKRVATSRFGAFAYVGRNTLVARTSGAPPVWQDHLLRLGMDASVWLARLNVYGLGMYGRNDNSVADFAHPDGTEASASFKGGFLQADWHARDHLAVTLRLDVVNEPKALVDENMTDLSVTPGVQLWLHERFKLSAEYNFPNRHRERSGAIQAELAF
jgi:hypothetical protein